MHVDAAKLPSRSRRHGPGARRSARKADPTAVRPRPRALLARPAQPRDRSGAFRDRPGPCFRRGSGPVELDDESFSEGAAFAKPSFLPVRAPHASTQQRFEQQRQHRAVDRGGEAFVQSVPEMHELVGRPARVDQHGGEVYVYRRTSMPCLLCGSSVRTAELVGRNIFWCPRCQPTFRSRAVQSAAKDTQTRGARP